MEKAILGKQVEQLGSGDAFSGPVDLINGAGPGIVSETRDQPLKEPPVEPGIVGDHQSDLFMCQDQEKWRN